jgi:hypothetical protein
VRKKQARVKKAILRHPSLTVVTQKNAKDANLSHRFNIANKPKSQNHYLFVSVSAFTA